MVYHTKVFGRHAPRPIVYVGAPSVQGDANISDVKMYSWTWKLLSARNYKCGVGHSRKSVKVPKFQSVYAFPRVMWKFPVAKSGFG